MPRGDGTGPNGMGRMSGRGAGYCAGFDGPGYANAAPGPGLGYGRGRGGRGWRNRFFATGQPGWRRSEGPPEAAALANPPEASLLQEISSLRQELEALKQRLSKPSSPGE